MAFNTETQIAFNLDTYIPKEFLKLKEEFNIETAVETGTMTGITTQWLSKHFKNVHTVELDPYWHKKSQEDCTPFDNINFVLGDSVQFIKSIVSNLKDERCLYFLDAHCGVVCPTPYELVEMAALNVKPIIAIHDFYVPGKDFGYDSYPNFTYNWESIKSLVDNLYGGEDKYTHYYNEIADGGRGIVYIKPTI